MAKSSTYQWMFGVKPRKCLFLQCMFGGHFEKMLIFLIYNEKTRENLNTFGTWNKLFKNQESTINANTLGIIYLVHTQKLSEKLIFLTPWYAEVHVFIRVVRNVSFSGKFYVRTSLMISYLKQILSNLLNEINTSNFQTWKKMF